MSVDSSYFKKWNPEVDYRERPDLYEIGRGQQGVQGQVRDLTSIAAAIAVCTTCRSSTNSAADVG